MEKFKSAKLVEKGSLDERWYVEYAYVHPESNKFKVFRVFISQKVKTKSGRREKGYFLSKSINAKLILGWNPFQTEEKRFTSVIEAIDYIFQIKTATTEKRTYYSYRYIVHTFKNFLELNKMDKMACDEFNFQHATAFMDYLKLERKFSNRSFNNYLSSMRTFFAEMLKREYISHNPFLRITMLQKVEPEILTYTEQEMFLIRTKLPEMDPWLYLCALMVYYAALRPAEICRIKLYYFDFQKRLIRIPGISTKNKKMQPIKMPDQLFNQLLTYGFEKYPQNNYLLSKNFVPGEIPIAPTRIAERWRKFANFIELDSRKTIYLLKHTSAGKAIESGINAREMQLHLRHHSLDMTQKYLEKFNNIGGESIQKHYPNF